MLDRTKAPPYRTITAIDVIRAKELKLSNGLELYTINTGSQEITRLEFIFRAGMYYQPATLVASVTNSMLDSGTERYTAEQLSEAIDFYGSFVETHVDQDFASLTLYCLNRYLNESLQYMADMLKHSTFPEKEFSILIAAKRQKHAINSQKVNVLARRKFSALLFGDKHPYGVSVNDNDFDRLTIEEIKRFYSARYSYKDCFLVASGKLPDGLVESVEKYFGTEKWGLAEESPIGQSQVVTSVEREHLIIVDDAVQSAIRVGRILFNKTHPDYFKFQVLNTVLGGYFGSRLMANIREDKGFTYGIGSGLNNLLHSGFFFIATEVGVDVTKQALDEIYLEMRRLQEEEIGAEELETVRNYILGQLLRSVDGPFALADKFKAIKEYGLDYSYYDSYFNAVKNVTSSELIGLAKEYLNREDMIECVAGKK